MATDLAARDRAATRRRQDGQRSFGAANLLAQFQLGLEHRVHSAFGPSSSSVLPVLDWPVRAGGAGRTSPDDPGAGRQPQRGVRHQRRAGLGGPAAEAAEGKRVRIPRGQCQRRAAKPPAARWPRLPRALSVHRPAIVILELGGNDGLRGLPVADHARQPRTAWSTLLAASGRAGAAARHADPAQLRPALHRGVPQRCTASSPQRKKLPLVPFFLDGVALDAGADAGRRPAPERRRPAAAARAGLADARARCCNAETPPRAAV